MTRDDAMAAAAAVDRLARRMAEHAHLGPELQRARRQFHGADGRSGPAIGSSAELRFLEWSTLERESEVLGAVPATLDAHAADAEPLLGSQVGVYLVLVDADGAVNARDLQNEAEIELSVPAGSLAPGDLLVGRLFVAGVDAWTPSVAAAVFRPGTELGVAFRRDLRRLDLDRRLWQIEIEHLMLRRAGQTPSPTADASAAMPVEHLEAAVEQLLTAAGCDLSATAISEDLLAARQPGPVIGPLLATLAFDTDIDIDRLRRLLFELWNTHHADADAGTAGPGDVRPGDVDADAPAGGEPLGERLARVLEEGLRQRRDVGELFQQIEEMAGIDADDESDDVDDDVDDVDDEDDDRWDAEGTIDDDLPEYSAASQEPHESEAGARTVAGDLGPLIQEYLWESELEQDPAALPLQQWYELQQNAPLPRADLELVTGPDLMRFLLHVYLAAGPTERATAVHGAFAALRGFYAWAARTQEFEIGAVLQECRGPLLDQLERLQAAGAALSTEHREDLRPRILTVEEVGPRGFGGSEDDGEHHWFAAAAAAVNELRVGDLVLGAMTAAPGKTEQRLCGLVVVLPADARSFME